jgi:hypothetical protein
MVAAMMRRRQGCPSARVASSQVETPRLVKSPNPIDRSIRASCTQRSRPVSASSAITRPSGVMRYITPSTTIGVASSERGRFVCTAGATSPVRYVHATASRATLAVSICASGECREPSASRPYAGHSLARPVAPGVGPSIRG